jgi:hypothetical protein
MTRRRRWRAVKAISSPPSHLHLLNVRQNIDCRTMRPLGLPELCCEIFLYLPKALDEIVFSVRLEQIQCVQMALLVAIFRPIS